MTALSCRSVFGIAIVLVSGAASAIAAPATTTIVAAPSLPAVQLAAMGDLPTVPHRRGGGRRSKEKDKPYQPLAKDPQGESAAAHKEYLKRYGF